MSLLKSNGGLILLVLKIDMSDEIYGECFGIILHIDVKHYFSTGHVIGNNFMMNNVVCNIILQVRISTLLSYQCKLYST